MIDALLSIARETVRKRGRRLEDLRFAKRTREGYVFYQKVQEGWDMWHEIVQKAKIAFPEYDMAVVVDISSELFNSDEEELGSIQAAF